MGVGWKDKVGAVHAGFRIGWAKGVVERKGETGFGSGDERGGHAAAPCVLGVNSQIPAMLESGVWQRLKKTTKPCCVAVVRHISIFHSVGLRNIVGSLLSSGRRTAFPQWVVLGRDLPEKGCRRNDVPRLCCSSVLFLYIILFEFHDYAGQGLSN